MLCHTYGVCVHVIWLETIQDSQWLCFGFRRFFRFFFFYIAFSSALPKITQKYFCEHLYFSFQSVPVKNVLPKIRTNICLFICLSLSFFSDVKVLTKKSAHACVWRRWQKKTTENARPKLWECCKSYECERWMRQQHLWAVLIYGWADLKCTDTRTP